MKNLIVTIKDKKIEIDQFGHIVENETIGKLHDYWIEKHDSMTFYRNKKHYSTLKEAFKALIGKVQRHPGVSYVLHINFVDSLPNFPSFSGLFLTRMHPKEHVITIQSGDERDVFCHIFLENNRVEYLDGDINEGNQFLAEWLPKKRNTSPTPLQKRIESFAEYNIQKIDFRGIVTDERKEIFFDELEYCFKQINRLFPLQNYYPIQEIYFSTYKKFRGKYAETKISLNPDCYNLIRDTIYHEFGHFLYDVGLLGNYPYFYKGKVERDKSIKVMDYLLNILYKEETLTKLNQRAEYRMNLRHNASKKQDIERFRSKEEQYLLRPTEVFARFFEAFMLSLDKQNGESTEYKLDFTENEIEKVKPILFDYLKWIQNDFLKEQAISK